MSGSRAEVDGRSGKPKKPRRAKSEKARSPAAQHFWDLVSPTWPTLAALKPVLEPWLLSKGVSWRLAGEFLTGLEPDFSQPQLLADFIGQKIGGVRPVSEFVNYVPNFPAEFSAKSFASTFLRSVVGRYHCFRPKFDVLQSRKVFSFSDDDDKHELELLDHGDSQPGTFTYQSRSAGGEDRGAWRGYAVAKIPHIFLCGFCRDGNDAAFFLLTPHPQEYSGKMLVGIQSLLVSHPNRGNVNHAVSRHIVAIKSEHATAETRAAAQQWIQTKQKESGGLVVDLSSRPSSTKT